MKTLLQFVSVVMVFMTTQARAVTLNGWSSWDVIGFEVSWAPEGPVDLSGDFATVTGLVNGYRFGLVAKDTPGRVEVSFLGAREDIPGVSIDFYVNDPVPGEEFEGGYERRLWRRLGLMVPRDMWWWETGEYSAFFALPLSVEVTDIPRWTDGPYCFCVPESGAVLLPAGACLGALFCLSHLRSKSV